MENDPRLVRVMLNVEADPEQDASDGSWSVPVSGWLDEDPSTQVVVSANIPEPGSRERGVREVARDRLMAAVEEVCQQFEAQGGHGAGRVMATLRELTIPRVLERVAELYPNATS